MKKSILTIAIALSVLSVVFTSCKKDKDEDVVTGQTEGTYDVKMDGQTIASGSTIEVGWLGNLITIANGDAFSVLVASVPENVGGVFQFDESLSTGTVTIMGQNLLLTDGSDELYFSHSGTVTRESDTKVTFEGTCKAMLSAEVHTFSGTVESDVFKLIYTP
ncbi:MAG: hypothetical protein RBS07_08880 [Lentimicrobium sp.]|jgi:glutamine cyclotransferase|nr:hypothetical protein [Lentimicrobium sp.]